MWCNDGGDEKTLTFGELSELSNRVANALSELGVRKGSVVMLILRRRWEYWVIAAALFKLGAILIPGSVQLTKKDLIYRAESAGIEMMVCIDDDYVIDQVEQALPECPIDQEPHRGRGRRATGG